MRLRLLIVGAVLPLLVFLLLPLLSQGATTEEKAAQIQKKIESKRGAIGRKKGTEKVLSGDIAQYSRRIGALSDKIGGLQTREQRVQADLDAKEAELERIRGDLRDERARLVRLRARLIVARRQLARRLVELYQADRPDLMTVVLNAKGFADLLERQEFIGRISAQDRSVVGLVRSAKKDATSTSKRLAGLEVRQREVTRVVAARRDEIVQIKQGLIDTRVGYSQTKAGKEAALTKVRTARVSLQDDLESLEKEQSRVKAALAAASTGFSAPSSSGAPPQSGTGQLSWPVNGPITGAFGEQRPGHMHAGLDIAAPGGTPIHAADGGRVAIAGWVGGYGNYTCIQHSASMSTCYGHQSRIGVSVGQSVSKGQVIGAVGNTGHSFGNHVHFEVRINGSPVSPLSYL